MSFLKRIGNSVRNAATNVASGARRLVSAVVPEAIQQRVNSFTDWLSSYVEPTQIDQVLDEVTEHVKRNYPPRREFEIREARSALRRFTTQYVIDGREGYDVQSFLSATKQNIVHLLEKNRRTKVKLIFRRFFILRDSLMMKSGANDATGESLILSWDYIHVFLIRKRRIGYVHSN